MFFTLICAIIVAIVGVVFIAVNSRRKSLLTPAQNNSCLYCKQAVRAVHDCAWNRRNVITFSDGKKMSPVPWSGMSPCPDCLVTTGNFHHPDCPDEECPQCHELLCDCSCELMKQ